MTNKPLLSPIIHEKIHFFAIICVVITMNFLNKPAFLSISMIIAALNWILANNFSEKIQIIKQKPIIWVAGAFLLLYGLSVFYSENKGEALTDLQLKLPIFLCPLMFLTSPKFTKKQLDIIFYAFITALLVGVFLSFLVAFKKNYAQNQLETIISPLFFYGNISFGFSHAGYHSLYIIIGIFVLFDKILHENLSQIKLIIHILLILIFIGFLLLLSSRMPLLMFMLLFISGVIYAIIKNKKYIIGFGIIGIMLLVFVSFLNYSETGKRRFAYILSSFNKENLISTDGTKDNSLAHDWDGIPLRIALIELTFNAIKNNTFGEFLFGVGNGDTEDNIIEAGNRQKVAFIAKHNRYDAHNQYLETLLGTGILGFCLLLMFLYLHFKEAIKQKNWLYLNVMLLLSLYFLTEAVLSVQQGVAIFGIFPCLFQITQKEENNNQYNETL